MTQQDYMAWFLAFYTLLCLLALILIGGGKKWRQGLLVVRHQAVIMILILAVLLICIAPFLYLYLPRAVKPVCTASKASHLFSPVLLA